MAHYLSQEQVLDIRARLFSNEGRVTVAGVRNALRVVGQDELTDEEVLRLVGFDSSTTPLGSFKQQQQQSAADAASHKKSSDRKTAKEQRRKARREEKKRLKTRHDYFLGSTSSDSDEDDNSNNNNKNSGDKSKNTAAGNGGDGGSGGLNLPMKLESDYAFPSAVDFPMFLQRLNRLVQDREVVRELKQLFYVLARFAFERRQKDMLFQQQQQQSTLGKMTSGAFGGSAGAGGGRSPPLSSSQQQQQQQQQSHDSSGSLAGGVSGVSSGLASTSVAALSNNNSGSLSQQQRQYYASSPSLPFFPSSYDDGGGGAFAAPSAHLHARSSRSEMECFLQIRAHVDKTSLVAQQRLELQRQLEQEEDAALQKALQGADECEDDDADREDDLQNLLQGKKPVDRRAERRKRVLAEAATKRPAAASATAMFFGSEESNLMGNPTLMTREELRMLMGEVFETAARKSTGIDHVLAGLEEGEHFVTCEKFVSLILRGGPEVVALPFLL